MIGISIIAIYGLIIIVATLFLIFSPQFGKSATKEKKIEYAKSGNYENGKFINQNPTTMDLQYWELIKKMIKDSPNRKPNENIIVEKINLKAIENHNTGVTKLTWFGHSTFLLEMGGKKILIDPMLGKSPSPHSLIGPKRYSKEVPIEIEKLPAIEAVILSHDHYDHLDYESIQKLKGKVGHYFTPLGVGNHLVEWGIAEEKISELYWWESIEFDSIKLVCTPARHFSGRGIFDRSTTLWCSWVIAGKKDNIFFSGDSGYDTHFMDIGEKYGPFDISLMECGQYNEDWKLLHMMPEEAVLASIDLKSKLILPIHWGAFTLAFHDWNDPIERITKKAHELNMPVTTPKIGEPVILGKTTFPSEKWWTIYVSKNE
ncbi:MAG: MBL fold metallo-hydrolase [Bacteroidetes bacterium]|nr:MBL fold metallo-hydrolase [Bacteroidota bacterium]MBL6944022.1 MBL fold metallo-hydrolase [Bacteroidales bacterium]